MPETLQGAWLEGLSESIPASRHASLVGGASVSSPKGFPSNSTGNSSVSSSENVELSSRTQLVSDSSQVSASPTAEGLHLLLYKDESSFSSMQSPCAVVALEHCLKLSSLPTHTKSEYTFTISFTNKDLLFYTDTKYVVGVCRRV